MGSEMCIRDSFPTASISSIKIMAGEFFRAVSNNSLTFLEPVPMIGCMKSDPLIKKNLLKRQSKYEAELDVISKRLSNKSFVDRAPKNIVDQEKNNYNELQKNIDKISITVKGL